MAKWLEFGRVFGQSVQPACGSDSVLPIDGRWGSSRIADAAHQHIERVNRLGKQYKAWRVIDGDSLLTARPINDWSFCNGAPCQLTTKLKEIKHGHRHI